MAASSPLKVWARIKGWQVQRDHLPPVTACHRAGPQQMWVPFSPWPESNLRGYLMGQVMLLSSIRKLETQQWVLPRSAWRTGAEPGLELESSEPRLSFQSQQHIYMWKYSNQHSYYFWKLLIRYMQNSTFNSSMFITIPKNGGTEKVTKWLFQILPKSTFTVTPFRALSSFDPKPTSSVPWTTAGLFRVRKVPPQYLSPSVWYLQKDVCCENFSEQSLFQVNLPRSILKMNSDFLKWQDTLFIKSRSFNTASVGVIFDIPARQSCNLTSCHLTYGAFCQLLFYTVYVSLI